MDMDWKEFQDFVADVQRQLLPDWNVLPDQYEADAAGIERQLDAILAYEKGPYPQRLLIEATTKRLDVQDVDAFITKAQRLKCQKVVIVSAKGFTDGALKAATHAGNVETWILREPKEKDFEGTIGKVSGVFNFSVPETKNIKLDLQSTGSRQVSVTFSAATRDQFTVYDADGLGKGNLWDFLVTKSNIAGHYVFPLPQGAHLYLHGTKVPLKEFSFDVEVQVVTHPFEVDLDREVVAVYEDAQTGKVRFIHRIHKDEGG